jgi:hypothetical protein
MATDSRTPHTDVLGTLAEFLATRDRARLPVVYLAGPMSGLPEFNIADFQEHARKIRLFGFPVLSPADLGVEAADRADAEVRRFDLIRHADLCVLLPDWEDAPEARADFDAFNELGRPIVTLETFLRKVLLYYIPGQEARAIMRLDHRRHQLNVAYEAQPGGYIYVGPHENCALLSDIADVLRDAARLDAEDLRDDEPGDD